jgi:sulfate transport system ATP-binding protein
MNEGRVEQVGTPAEVYDSPANPFVLNFLGNVNLFHGRVHKGLVTLGGIKLTAPEHATADDTPAVGYVRSHDLVIERETSENGSIAAEVKQIHAVGPVVRITLALNGNHGAVEAELTRDTFKNLALERGEKVFVRPRNVRVFVEDYQI